MAIFQQAVLGMLACSHPPDHFRGDVFYLNLLACVPGEHKLTAALEHVLHAQAPSRCRIVRFVRLHVVAMGTERRLDMSGLCGCGCCFFVHGVVADRGLCLAPHTAQKADCPLVSGMDARSRCGGVGGGPLAPPRDFCAAQRRHRLGGVPPQAAGQGSSRPLLWRVCFGVG